MQSSLTSIGWKDRRSRILLVTPDCGGPVPMAYDATVGVRISAASWQLVWDRSGVTPSAGGGWSVVTNRGYTVHVDTGSFSNHSISLGQCQLPVVPVVPVVPDDAGAVGWRFGLGIRSALAHDDSDVSTLELSLIEDLGNLSDQGPFNNVFPATTYCRAH